MLMRRFGFDARAREDILRYSPRARQTTTMCACSPQLIQASFLRGTMGLKRSIARRAGKGTIGSFWCANGRGRPEQKKAAHKRSAELRSGLNHFLAFENSTDIFEFRGDVAPRETDLS